MRTSETDILIIPGYGNSDADHWQSRWERNLKTANRVEQADWLHPDRDSWVARIADAVSASQRPVVLVAHSLGVATVLHAASAIDVAPVAGAFLVSPSDLDAVADWPTDDGQDWPAIVSSFAPMPTASLPFPARVIASSDDKFCSTDRAFELGKCWNADVSILANAGHINTTSGHGPWPEGLLSFGMFMKSLTSH